ncbi:hypothetical protein D3C76_1089480 [compost metagenome]
MWVIERPLAGRLQFGIGHGDFLAQDFGTAAQGGFVQGEQRRAAVHRLVGAHLDLLDHAVDGRTDDLCLARDDFRRGQGGLPYRQQQQGTEHDQAQQQLPAIGPPAAQAPMPGQRGPAVAPGADQPFEVLPQHRRRLLLQQQQQQTKALPVTVLERNAPEARRPPLAPAFDNVRRRGGGVLRQPYRCAIGHLSGDPATGPAQPDEIRRILAGA